MVLDDDPVAVDTLVQYIGMTIRLRVGFAGTDPLVALQKFDRLKPNILFIDMEMEKMSGLDFLAQVKDRMGLQPARGIPLQVIVCSAYRDYGVDCIAYQVCDYLLKPFTFQRFIESVTKARGYVHRTASIATLKGGFELFLVKTGKGMTKKVVRFDDIICVEAYGNHTILWCEQDMQLETTLQMAEIELMLPPDVFVKVHRSYVISLDYVDEVSRTEVKMHYLKNPVPIGDRNHYRDFVNWEIENTI